MKIHTVRKSARKLYCGPYALCAVSGWGPLQVLDLIEEIRGPNARDIAGKRIGVRGMTNPEMCKVLRRMGLPWDWTSNRDLAKSKPTLSQYAHFLRATGDKRVRIVQVRGHYVTMTGTMFADNWTKKNVRIGDAPKPRRRVIREWAFDD